MEALIEADKAASVKVKTGGAVDPGDTLLRDESPLSEGEGDTVGDYKLLAEDRGGRLRGRLQGRAAASGEAAGGL